MPDQGDKRTEKDALEFALGRASLGKGTHYRELTLQEITHSITSGRNIGMKHLNFPGRLMNSVEWQRILFWTEASIITRN